MVKKYVIHLSNGTKYQVAEKIRSEIMTLLKDVGKGLVSWGDYCINLAHVCSIEPHVPKHRTKKEKEDDVEMDLKQFVAYTQQSKSKHVHFIGDWAETTNANHTMKSQWDVYMSRHMKAAASVVKFPREKIVEALKQIVKDSENFTKYQPTIETIIKYLTH